MRIQENVSLGSLLWYKIGGSARYVIDTHSQEDVGDALKFIKENAIQKVFICGLGSNLIFSDDYFDGAVIRIIHGEQEEIKKISANTVKAYAGEILDHVITYSFDNGLHGLEWAGGLPGTVGAAVRGNVGAFGGETKDFLHSAEVLIRGDKGQYEIKNITNHDLKFSYRHSLIKEHPGAMIVLSATYLLKASSEEESILARQTYEKNKQFRRDRHPLEYPNCGSVFKNIKKPEEVAKVLQIYPDIKDKVETQWYGKVAAGFLIQRLGLQGFRVGDAQVSTKHALFIVNLGQAKAKDVLTVIETIQTKFLETFGFMLEPEVEIVR